MYPYTSTTRMTDLHLARGKTKTIIYILREFKDLDEFRAWDTRFVPAVNFCVFKEEKIISPFHLCRYTHKSSVSIKKAIIL